MNRHKESLDAAYFEEMFQNTRDPWNLESSPYEQEKYAATLGALEDRTYASGFEIGCAKGVLTKGLARHCQTLLAIDVSETALQAARERCDALDHVSFARMAFPGQAPLGCTFDLIVLSEVAYYWDDADIVRAADWIKAHKKESCDLLLVHWSGETDYPQSGDEAVSKLRNALGDTITPITSVRHDQYRLDLWCCHS